MTGGLSPLLEKPDTYNGLYLLGKMAESFLAQRAAVGARSSVSWRVSCEEMFILCNF